MNLSDFIDRLIEVESKCRSGGWHAPVELPVYVVDSRNDDSGQPRHISIAVNKHKHVEGELLDLDEGLTYIEIGVG